ncbi:MAG TPA: MraY family glycosyltransferase [Rectinemataceae bacterium]|nr:MraY family glycosyltransferase [Rectinemataceae bacterium]
MPMIIGFARKKNLYDSTGGRKIHSGKIPRLGGVGMFWAFYLALGIFALIGSRGFLAGFAGRLPRLAPMAIGAAGMHFLGFADDLRSLPAKRKFLFQSFIAGFIVVSGFRFRGLGYDPDLLSSTLGWFSAVVSWGWIVGMTNAINLIDGMDGLAGGISAIVSSAFGCFYLLAGDLPSAFICLTLAGAVIGFLSVNFPAPKARLFMGDSGSLFLGFALSVMPFLGQTGSAPVAAKGSLEAGLIPSMALLAIPLIDTLRAIFRRRRAGLSIGSPDRKHVHHLLLDHGYGPRRILNIIYFITTIQASLFIVARAMRGIFAYLLTAASLAIAGAFFLYIARLPTRAVPEP